jgi:hypothetical protein
MKKKGLQVIHGDPAEWAPAVARAAAVIRGKVVPIAVYDKVKSLRDEYRAAHPR